MLHRMYDGVETQFGESLLRRFCIVSETSVFLRCFRQNCLQQSVGAQFKNQLNNLLGAIGETHPHYVRCLKPNDDNVRSNFNIGRITSQLANGGEQSWLSCDGLFFL